MKKLPITLETPARVVIAVGLIVLVGELLIMLLIENIQHTPLKDVFLERLAIDFIDPILLTILVVPALFLLIFKPMRAQQVELERQLDELGRFQRVGIGRELRMKELVEENTALRHPLSAEPAGDISVTSGSLEKPRPAAAQHATVQPTEQGQLSVLLFMLEDLERSQHQVEQAHREWLDALDVVDDPIFLHDKDFRILRCNRAYQQCAGIPFEQIIGQPYYEVFPKTDAPLPCCLRAMEKAGDEEEVAVGDATYRSRAFPIHDKQGAYLYSVHTLEDITKSRRAEAALRESEEKFRKITESAQDAIIIMADKHISFWNAAAERIFGYTAAEALGQEMHPLITPPTAHAAFVQGFKHFRESGEGPVIGKVVEVIALRKGGEKFSVELSISATQLNGQWHAIGIVRDITERKHRETEILAIRNKLQAIFDAIPDLLFETGLDGRFYDYHSPHADLLAVPAEVFLGKTVSDVLPPDVAEVCMSALREANEKGRSIGKQYELQVPRDKLWFELSISRKPTDPGQVPRFIVLSRDITERKQAEAAIQHANRALATLSAVNRELVHATVEEELLRAICQVIVTQRGYQMAWVGYVQHDESKSIKIMAHAGHDEGYLDAMQLTWAESERGMEPSGRAVRSGATQLCQDIANDPRCLPWHDAARQHGYAANIALPLLNGDNTVFGILNVYAAEANAFTPNEIDLLEEMAGDLAYGVLTLQTRHERDLALVKNQEQLVQLQDSLEHTMLAIARIVEMRDPYTAGHQVRVADLAAAIAKQMGLPDEQVHGIHLAGTVHDLGKIQIPAEILSKPGKITDIEHSLIKVHPQAGYDILKGIDFPWPIAQMVLQHHERLNGSGYPQGLKGDAILLEARILSVADVVEAISAHRPYRPGLGIETALAEISKQRGVYYDSQVVDACLVLFREQGYQLPS